MFLKIKVQIKVKVAANVRVRQSLQEVEKPKDVMEKFVFVCLCVLSLGGSQTFILFCWCLWLHHRLESWLRRDLIMTLMTVKHRFISAFNIHFFAPVVIL